jgi:hypothetical protein
MVEILKRVQISVLLFFFFFLMIVQDGVGGMGGICSSPQSMYDSSQCFRSTLSTLLHVLVYLLPFYKQTLFSSANIPPSLHNNVGSHAIQQLIVRNFSSGCNPTIRYHGSVFRGISFPSPEIACECFAGA